MFSYPGRDVSNTEYVELRLKGQIGELEEMALYSSAAQSRDVEDAARTVRNLTNKHTLSFDDESKLVSALGAKLTSVDKVNVTEGFFTEILGILTPYIPENQQGSLAKYVPKE